MKTESTPRSAQSVVPLSPLPVIGWKTWQMPQVVKWYLLNRSLPSRKASVFMTFRSLFVHLTHHIGPYGSVPPLVDASNAWIWRLWLLQAVKGISILCRCRKYVHFLLPSVGRFYGTEQRNVRARKSETARFCVFLFHFLYVYTSQQANVLSCSRMARQVLLNGTSNWGISQSSIADVAVGEKIQRLSWFWVLQFYEQWRRLQISALKDCSRFRCIKLR